MISVNGISKKYSKDSGIFDLSFEIESNSLALLLGPNGAGKSTCLKVLSTLSKPDSGAASMNGLDLLNNKNKLQEIIGYVPELIPHYSEFTIYEILSFLGDIRGIEKKELDLRIKKILQEFDLLKFQHKLCSDLSKGMLQTVGICQAILHKPKVLLLDEPGSGLDATQLQNFIRILNKLKKTTSILISTHYASSFAFLADRVLFMKGGRIVDTLSGADCRKSISSLDNLYGLSEVANI